MTRTLSDTRPLDFTAGDRNLLPPTRAWKTLQGSNSSVDTSGAIFKPKIADSRRINWDEGAEQLLPHGLPALQQLAAGTIKVLPRFQSILAAAWIDLFAIGRGWSLTDQVDVGRVVSVIQHIQRQSIGISKSLIVPRHKALESSLLVPSGAYLAWLEMGDEQSTD